VNSLSCCDFLTDKTLEKIIKSETDSIYVYIRLLYLRSFILYYPQFSSLQNATHIMTQCELKYSINSGDVATTDSVKYLLISMMLILPQ
jgi:hypothetical protein